MPDKLIQAPCGKVRNARNKLFTEQSLRDHIQSCPACKGEHVWVEPNDFIGNESDPALDRGLADDIASDESDGVYFAMRWELDGW